MSDRPDRIALRNRVETAVVELIGRYAEGVDPDEAWTEFYLALDEMEAEFWIEGLRHGRSELAPETQELIRQLDQERRQGWAAFFQLREQVGAPGPRPMDQIATEASARS